MKIAVDVCVGVAGMKLLRKYGHDVLTAENAEPDHDWFARARAWGAELIVSPDNDLWILCWDHNVEFFRARQGLAGLQIAHELLRYLDLATREHTL